MIKECFIDTETTGTNPVRAGIWQIGAIIRYDGKEVDRFLLECDVFEDDDVDPDALAMNGMCRISWKAICFTTFPSAKPSSPERNRPCI